MKEKESMVEESREEIEKEIERLREKLSEINAFQRDAVIKAQNKLCDLIKKRNEARDD